MSIVEIATELVEKTLLESNDDNSRTIFLVGSKATGKSTLLYSFLEKNDTPRETLVLDYSFGRKSNQKQGIEKIICHVWEYGGKLDLLKKVYSSISIHGHNFFCIMVDLSKIKAIWHTLETCLQTYTDRETETEEDKKPELIIIGGKYDIFKNYDSEIKKHICITIRSIAMIYNANLLFYSSKEPYLAKRTKEMLHNIGFGNMMVIKEKNTNFTKPLMIPKGGDSWESIGIAASTVDQIKARHLSRMPPESQVAADTRVSRPQRAHPESLLDTKIAFKYEQLRNLPSLDISLHDYLVNLN